MRINEISGFCGIEIHDLDLSQPRTPEMEQEIVRLFDKHGFVVFKNQKLTKRELHAAGSIFGGSLTDVAGTAKDPEAPGLVTVTTRGSDGNTAGPDEKAIVGDIKWHNDQTYTAKPARCRMLYAVEVAPEGGLTGFIDGRVTYATLPDDLKKRVDGLHVIHSWDFAEATISRQRAYQRDGKTSALQPKMFPDVAYPVVHTHPYTGVKVLNAPPLWSAGIVEMPGAEGKALIAELHQHMLQEKFQYWHRYELGDAVLWDNFCFIHAASGTPGRYARTLWSTAMKNSLEIGRVLTAA